MQPQSKHTAVFLALVAAVIVFAWGTGAARAQNQKASAQAERGSYLVTVGGCNDCHTPWRMGAKGPEPDMSKMLAGHPAAVTVSTPPKLPMGSWAWMGAGSFTAFAGPWGVSFAANLTPHKTGLGEWSEQQFLAAMRTGKHQGTGRPIMPPMPWPNLAKATDEDLRAIWAYLRSIPPVDNPVPLPRAVMGVKPAAAP